MLQFLHRVVWYFKRFFVLGSLALLAPVLVPFLLYMSCQRQEGAVAFLNSKPETFVTYTFDLNQVTAQPWQLEDAMDTSKYVTLPPDPAKATTAELEQAHYALPVDEQKVKNDRATDAYINQTMHERGAALQMLPFGFQRSVYGAADPVVTEATLNEGPLHGIVPRNHLYLSAWLYNNLPWAPGGPGVDQWGHEPSLGNRADWIYDTDRHDLSDRQASRPEGNLNGGFYPGTVPDAPYGAVTAELFQTDPWVPQGLLKLSPISGWDTFGKESRYIISKSSTMFRAYVGAVRETCRVRFLLTEAKLGIPTSAWTLDQSYAGSTCTPYTLTGAYTLVCYDAQQAGKPVPSAKQFLEVYKAQLSAGMPVFAMDTQSMKQSVLYHGYKDSTGYSWSDGQLDGGDVHEPSHFFSTWTGGSKSPYITGFKAAQLGTAPDPSAGRISWSKLDWFWNHTPQAPEDGTGVFATVQSMTTEAFWAPRIQQAGLTQAQAATIMEAVAREREMLAREAHYARHLNTYFMDTLDTWKM